MCWLFFEKKTSPCVYLSVSLSALLCVRWCVQIVFDRTRILKATCNEQTHLEISMLVRIAEWLALALAIAHSAVAFRRMETVSTVSYLCEGDRLACHLPVAVLRNVVFDRKNEVIHFFGIKNASKVCMLLNECMHYIF